MSAFDIDDIQFVDNTPEEAAEAKRAIVAELARLQAVEAERDALLNALELIDHMNAGYVSELAREARRQSAALRQGPGAEGG